MMNLGQIVQVVALKPAETVTMVGIICIMSLFTVGDIALFFSVHKVEKVVCRTLT